LTIFGGSGAGTACLVVEEVEKASFEVEAREGVQLALATARRGEEMALLNIFD